MEDKRGTKHAHHLPSKEGSPSLNGAKTPPSVPFGSSPPLTSPLKVSSRCPYSLAWEQGGSSGKAPVVDLSSSSDEGDLIAMSRGMRRSPEGFLVTSTTTSLGHPVMARSSSSATLMKKRRCTRRWSPTSKLRHVLC
jgi:hypothetical protein